MKATEKLTTATIKAVEFYGPDNQIVVAIEELSELQKELCKSIRGQQSREHIIEELADVMIIEDQLKKIFGITDNEIEMYIEYKTTRLLNRINYESGKGE